MVDSDQVDDSDGCNGDFNKKCHLNFIKVSSKALVRCATHLVAQDKLINGLID